MYSLCLYAMHVFLYVPERLHLDASVHVSLMIHVSHLAQTILFIFYLLLIPISGQKYRVNCLHPWDSWNERKGGGKTHEEREK